MSEIDDSTRQRKCRCGHTWLAVFPQDREHSCRQNYEQRITDLEQQLKTARLDAVRGVIRGINVNKWNSGAAEHYTATALEVWKVGFQDCRLAMIEYANNLEGK